MRTTRKTMLVVLLMLALLALTSSVAFAQDPEQGQVVWEEALCQRCHGEMGEGVYGKPLAGDDELTLEDWITQTRTPRRRMPAFSEEQISDEIIADMFAYLTSLDKPTENNFQQHDLGEDAHPGQVVMVEKRCVACHGLNGPIRGFNRRAQMPTAEPIINQVRTPRNRMPSFSEEQISDAEIADIADFLAQQFSPQVQAVPSPAEKAADGLGGQAALERLSTLVIEASGTRWVLDEGYEPGSEAEPIGPFTTISSIDITNQNIRVDHTRTAAGQERAVIEIVASDIGYLEGQDARFGPPAQRAMSSDRVVAVIKQQLLLNPQIILQEVLANPSMASDTGEVIFDGVVHHRLDVVGLSVPLTLYIHAGSGQIAKLSTWESTPLRRDVALDVFYYGWQSIGAEGLSFPAEVYIALDGEIVHQEIRNAITVNPSLEEGIFDFPAEAASEPDEALAIRGDVNHQYLQMFAHLGFPRDGAQTNVVAEELAAGVYHLRGGSHHSLAIEQADGIVIVEAPLDETRSQAIMAWVSEAFPDKAVTYAVASHHHVDHSAGLRAFAAAGATIVVHETAADFFAEMFTAESTVVPDMMSENPVAASIEAIPADGAVILEDDDLAVEVYPMANPHAEDLVLVYVAGVAFVVDIYSPNPQATSAGFGGQVVADTIEALGLDVSIIAGGHGASIDMETFAGLLGGQ